MATGKWIVDTSGKTPVVQLINTGGTGSLDVALSLTTLYQLFPPSLRFASAEKTTCMYRIYSQELETEIWKAIENFTQDVPHQCRAMTMHENKFDLAEKTRRAEYQRTTYRIDTRLYQVVPELKTQVYFLCPSRGTANVQQQKQIVFRTIQDIKELQQLNSKYEIYHKTPYPFRFRGSLPVSIMKSDLPTMYDNRQFLSVAVKTNGLRCFLLAVTFYNEPMVIMMDRSLKLYLIALPLPSVWFCGTILDGELVSLENGKYGFIVYDTWQINGVPLAQESYLNRLQIASLAVHQWKHEMQKDKQETIFDVRMKSVYSIEQVPTMLMNELSAMDHYLDGLIITAVEPSAPMGRATNQIYKYKVGNDNTIDCLIQYINDTKLHLLCVVKANEYALWSEIPDLQAAQHTDLISTCKQLGFTEQKTWSELAKALHGKVVECACVQVDNKQNKKNYQWKLKTVREKAEANLLATAEKTFRNIEENLLLDDIFPPEYCSWPTEQRQKLKQWETGFQKLLNVNWTMVPQLKMGTQKNYIPIRPLAPVSLHEINKKESF